MSAAQMSIVNKWLTACGHALMHIMINTLRLLFVLTRLISVEIRISFSLQILRIYRWKSVLPICQEESLALMKSIQQKVLWHFQLITITKMYQVRLTSRTLNTLKNS